MSPSERITPEDVVSRKLDGAPEQGFDCGSLELNSFLYEHAWEDQQELLSTTYRYYVDGIFAAFATYLMDGLPLDFRERGVRIRYETVGALKLGQLGVDSRFQGCGLGKVIVGDAVGLAKDLGDLVGCRYVSVDALPGLEPWYERLGFKRNKLMQKRRIQFALAKNRDPERLATSMRFEVRDV